MLIIIRKSQKKKKPCCVIDAQHDIYLYIKTIDPFHEYSRRTTVEASIVFLIYSPPVHTPTARARQQSNSTKHFLVQHFPKLGRAFLKSYVNLLHICYENIFRANKLYCELKKKLDRFRGELSIVWRIIFQRKASYSPIKKKNRTQRGGENSSLRNRPLSLGWNQCDEFAEFFFCSKPGWPFQSFLHRSQTTVGPVLDNVVELEETIDRSRISSAFRGKNKNQLPLQSRQG